MDTFANDKPSYHGAVAEHIRLLDFSRDVASKLIEDPRIKGAAIPILLHQDLHKRNIFVSDEDPTTITDIIDWQSSSINPAFIHANEMPDFASYTPTPNDQLSKEEHNAAVHAECCNKAYVAGVRLLVPKLPATWDLDEDVTRYFEYCHRTYRDGAGVLRQILMDLAKRWKELALPGSCPYPSPTPDEEVAHREEYEALEQAQGIRKFITSRLNTTSDGWVPAEAWKETIEEHKQLYDLFLQNMGEEDLKEIWPFDEPSSLLMRHAYPQGEYAIQSKQRRIKRKSDIPNEGSCTIDLS